MYWRTSLLAVYVAVVSIEASADTISFTSTSTLNLAVTADAVTVGPDGNLWLLDSEHNSVGQFTPDGSYHAFAIPTADARPWAIATGADGNLWFTEAQVPGKIARVTPAGVVTEFPVPSTMAGFPWLMAATPDGSIWFLELGDPSKPHNLDRVGRLDAFGTFSEFQVKNAVKLDAVDPAVDGVWLFDDDPSTNRLMKMKADGSIAYSQSMPSTTYNGASAGVTALDGTFWFVHNTGLDRVEDSGSITEYHIPWANAAPAGIASGGDGNIWFTDYNTGQIGQLVVSSATSGGQATINGSASVGTNLAEAVFLPASFAATAAGSRGVASLEIGHPFSVLPPLAAEELLFRRDVKTRGNLIEVGLPAAPQSADLRVNHDLEWTYTSRSTAVVTEMAVEGTVTNGGPSFAVETLTIEASGEIRNCDFTVGSCKIIPPNKCVCKGTGLGNGEGGKYYVTMSQPQEQHNRDVYVTISSDLPDPNIVNNSEDFINLDNVYYEALPSPNQPVVTDPGTRGGH